MGFLSAQYTFVLAAEEDIPLSYAGELDSILLFQDQPAIMVHPSHPFAEKTAVGIHELANETLFLPMQGLAQHDRLVKLFQTNDVEIPNATSCSYQFYRHIVEEKLGIAFSTVRGGRIDNARVRHIPIENKCPPWNMRLYWRKDRPLTEDEAIFKGFVETFYETN